MQTYFQQKWASKAATRAYHGETIREGQWERMFRPTTRSVVEMVPKELAHEDGYTEALGRGSGLIKEGGRPRGKPRHVPYMNMVYAPVERRLDTAIHRALFASSTRQARQFCVHGYVKVNGQKMVYPGYQLNPGDMFQVEPERVLYATGAPKTREELKVGTSKTATSEDLTSETKSSDASEATSEEGTSEAESADASEAEAEQQAPEEILSSLLKQAKAVLSDEKRTAPAKRKQNIRLFQRLVRKTLSKQTGSVDAQLLEFAESLNLQPPETPESSTPTPDSTTTSKSDDTEQPNNLTSEKAKAKAQQKARFAEVLEKDQQKLLEKALVLVRENPSDPTKTYATPWSPREYMSAFAFIPRYLEVHHKICSAVYLRHPVARAGTAEVPTPFGQEVNGLAFNWYLRRR